VKRAGEKLPPSHRRLIMTILEVRKPYIKGHPTMT